MHWSKSVLSALAATTAASARPVSNGGSSVYSGWSGITDYSRVSDPDRHSRSRSDVESNSTTGSEHAASPSVPKPDEPAVVTISPSRSPRDPSRKKCLELYQKLLDHDPHLFDLARCPVNGKSVMWDALSRGQETHQLEDTEEAELEELMLEFHKAMEDDCEEGKRRLRDHHPEWDALLWLVGLTGAGGCVAYVRRKDIRGMVRRYRQRRYGMSGEVALPDYQDGESDDDDQSDDETPPARSQRQ